MTDAQATKAEAAKQPPEPQQGQARSLALAMPTTDTGILQARNYGEAIEIAKMFAHSGMVPKQYDGNTGAVLVAMQMGAELGLSPMSSLQSIAVINGRPSVWGDAMLALVMNHRDFVDISEAEGEGFAKCVVKRRGRSPTERVFTIDDAKKAQLWGKQGPWQQYPRRMLQLRARGFALRDAFPDALRGIISAEEARDYPADVDGGAPEYASPADIPEGTHKLGGKRKSQNAPTTGEVIEEPQQAPKAQQTKTTKSSPVQADPKAGF